MAVRSAKSAVIAILAGGTSREREVSLGSGRACEQALKDLLPTEWFTVDAEALPEGLDPARHVVLSMLHGTFGEDGAMQRLLEAAGIEYAGCDAECSALTMDKSRTKQVVAGRGLRIPRELAFDAQERRPSAAEIAAVLGPNVVLKPNDQGSSVGLSLAKNESELASALRAANDGRWLAEERVLGRELSVGVLNGRALGVVEIRPKSGVYDYESKYTKGLTEYFVPAPLDESLTARVRVAAETAFAACRCRDYARVDFMLRGADEIFFLELNTLPGMKETSLLPMSARCSGLNFPALVRELVNPALKRFRRPAGLASR